MAAHHFISPTKLRTSHNKVTPRTNRKAAEVSTFATSTVSSRSMSWNTAEYQLEVLLAVESWSVSQSVSKQQQEDKRTRQASAVWIAHHQQTAHHQQHTNAHERTRTRLFVVFVVSGVEGSTAHTHSQRPTNERSDRSSEEGRKEEEGRRKKGVELNEVIGNSTFFRPMYIKFLRQFTRYGCCWNFQLNLLDESKERPCIKDRRTKANERTKERERALLPTTHPPTTNNPKTTTTTTMLKKSRCVKAESRQQKAKTNERTRRRQTKAGENRNNEITRGWMMDGWGGRQGAFAACNTTTNHCGLVGPRRVSE